MSRNVSLRLTIRLQIYTCIRQYNCSLETWEYIYAERSIARQNEQEMYILQDCPTFSWNIIEGINCEESESRQLSCTNVQILQVSCDTYILTTSRFHATLIYISDEVPLIRQININHETVSKLVVNAGSTFSQ